MTGSYSYTATQAKELILKGMRQGRRLADILDEVGKSEKSYEYYRKSDTTFKSRVDEIRALRAGSTPGAAPNGKPEPRRVPDFPEFAERYLGIQLFRHQLQWVDLIEGRAPRDRHPSQQYELGWMQYKKLYIVNTPPDHAKTATLSIAYATYRIIKNPNIRILIISKTQDLAKDICGAIRSRLDSRVPMFEELKRDFAPAEGFEAHAQWRADRFFLNPEVLTSGEKDPTCQAKGMGQQIYGKRADLIIMDDCIDLANAHDYEKQIKWTQKEVQSRLVEGGVLLIAGTRLAPQDLYSEIRRPDRYPNGSSPYTYLTQPAVLELTETPETWTTLWPKSNRPPDNLEMLDYVPAPDENGLFDRFTGSFMSQLRDSMPANDWALVYMQQQVSEDQTFKLDDLNGCTGVRFPGPMVDGVRGHRPGGMAGLYVIAGLDPAASNYTAAVVLGVDRQTGRRHLLDVYNKHHALPSELNALIKGWTTQYGVMEWRIEANAYQASITQDEDILKFCRSRGTNVTAHYTGKNKWDPMYGVASMAYLFRGWETGANMIELPNRQHHGGVKTLVEQLTTWYPTPNMSKAPIQDTVMALWFAEIRARELVNEMERWDYMDNSYLSDRQSESRVVIDLDDWMARSHYADPFDRRLT